MNRPTYTGIFFEDGTHMTWHFDIESLPKFPYGIQEGDMGTIKVIGRYEDEEVACLIVEWEEYIFSLLNVYLHITTKALIEPQYSGIRATEFGWDAIGIPYCLTGKWGYGS